MNGINSNFQHLLYAIIGAHSEDTDGSDSGAAYIFKRTGTTWAQQAKLMASNSGANDQFSRNALGISGDYAFVGADQEDTGGTDRGMVYIYKRNEVTSSTVSEHPPSALTSTESGGGGGYKVTSSSDAYDNTGFYLSLIHI